MSENTNDYEPYNAIVEPAISDISDSVPLPVKTGAQSYMWNKIAASSTSTAEVRFDVNVNPGHLIQREVYVSGELKLKVEITKGTSTGPSLLFGETDAVRPFFFNQMISQASVNIGNSLFILSQRDIFDGLLKCTSKKFLSRWNSQTASYIDNSYKNYTDAQGTLNNPLQGFEDSISSAIFNGAYPIDVSNVKQFDGNTPLAGTNSDSITAWATNATRLTADISLKVNEPLFVNPFIYNGDLDQNKAAIYGINSFNIILQLTNDANHMFCRIPNGATVKYSFADVNPLSKFIINFTTMIPQINQILPIKSVYPLKKIDRFLSDNNQPDVGTGAIKNIISPNINLGSMPDYLVIYVRKKQSEKKLEDASSAFFPIDRLRLQLNNNDNLLSSLNSIDLWKLSVKNGSNQSYYEFGGSAQVGKTTSSETKNTIGSLVIISATDLNLQSPMAPGTLSNIVLNVSCDFKNNESVDIKPQLVVMTISNAIMTIANGNVSMTNSLFYEANNAAVLSNNSLPIKQDLSYSTRQGGNLSTSIATKLNKSLKGGNSGSGLRSAGNTGSSLFY